MMKCSVSYRSFSDITTPFIYYIDRITDLKILPSPDVRWRPFERNFTDLKLINMTMTKKKKNIVAVISHCKALSKRDLVIRSLRKFIQIDVYGKCGRKKLAKNY